MACCKTDNLYLTGKGIAAVILIHPVKTISAASSVTPEIIFLLINKTQINLYDNCSTTA
jgi:hypothetical protein